MEKEIVTSVFTGLETYNYETFDNIKLCCYNDKWGNDLGHTD